jgi:hypothetical protein
MSTSNVDFLFMGNKSLVSVEVYRSKDGAPPAPAGGVTDGDFGSGGWLGDSAFNGKQHIVAVNPRKPDHLLEFEAELLQEPDGALIIWQSNAEHSLQTKRAKAVVEHSPRSLESEALGPVFLQERKSNVGVLQRIALNKPADSDGYGPFPKRHEIQAVAELHVTGYKFVYDVRPRIFDSPNAAVTNILNVCGLVHKSEDKLVVRGGYLPKGQSRRPDLVHRMSWPNFDPIRAKDGATLARQVEFLTLASDPVIGSASSSR